MPAKSTPRKVECLNPNTGRTMNIDKGIYDLISRAIRQSLKQGQPLTFSQMVESIHDYIKREKIKFEGSVDWYAISVKHDMHARGMIEVVTEKGKKLHRLRNKE